jgi:hypothetical protein
LQVSLNSVRQGQVSRRVKCCIIVSGVHRSGTSAVARLVNLLGADIGGDLLPKNRNNCRGYWESQSVVNIHANLLKAVGTVADPFDPAPLRADWLTTGFAREAKSRLADRIRSEFAASHVFVVKDPRISRLLPLWVELLSDLKIAPVVVVPFRNPLEVVASLAQRDGLPPPKTLLLYFHAYLQTEYSSRSVPRMFVRYDGLLEDWRPFAGQLAQISRACLSSPAGEVAKEIDEFLTTTLHHHRFSRAQMMGQPGISAEIIEMFDLMDSTARTGDDHMLRAAFDRFRADADAATRLYRGFVMAELGDLRREIVRQRQTFETSTSWRVTAPLRWLKSNVLAKIGV